MQFGCCIPVAEISAASSCGYDFCELPGKEIASFSDAKWAVIAQDIAAAKIPVIGFNSFCGSDLPLVGPDVCVKQQDSYIECIVNRGADLGICNIGIGAPKARILPAGYSVSKADDQMIDFLHRICRKANEKGICVLLEALNPYSCNYCNTLKKAAELCRRCNEKNLHLVYDVYHAVLAGETYAEAEKYFSEVKHVHVCSWNCATRERYFLQKKDTSYLQQLCCILHDCHYNGTISIEAKGSQIREQGKISLQLLKECI